MRLFYEPGGTGVQKKVTGGVVRPPIRPMILALRMVMGASPTLLATRVRPAGELKGNEIAKAGGNDSQRQLEQERKKLQNLIAAIEGGASAPSTLLKAIADRKAMIKQLEADLRKREDKPPLKPLPELSGWVNEQLKDIVGLLESDPARVKSEFRRLDLQLTFHPTEAEPRPHYVVKGQCDLSALVFSFFGPMTRRRSNGPTDIGFRVRLWAY